MRLTAKTRLGELLEAHPLAIEVFQDNGIELDEVGPESPLSAIAKLNEIDIDELLAELREELDPDEEDEFGFDDSGTRRDDDEEEEDFTNDDDDDDDDYTDDDDIGDIDEDY